MPFITIILEMSLKTPELRKEWVTVTLEYKLVKITLEGKLTVSEKAENVS